MKRLIDWCQYKQLGEEQFTEVVKDVFDSENGDRLLFHIDRVYGGFEGVDALLRELKRSLAKDNLPFE